MKLRKALPKTDTEAPKRAQVPSDEDAHIASPIEPRRIPEGYVENDDYTVSPRSTVAKSQGLVSPPKHHLVGTEVPSGGSSCSSCKFLRSASSGECGQSGWVNTPRADGGGGGDPHLPKPPNRYCCDYWDQ